MNKSRDNQEFTKEVGEALFNPAISGEVFADRVMKFFENNKRKKYSQDSTTWIGNSYPISRDRIVIIEQCVQSDDVKIFVGKPGEWHEYSFHDVIDDRYYNQPEKLDKIYKNFKEKMNEWTKGLQS